MNRWVRGTIMLLAVSVCEAACDDGVRLSGEGCEPGAVECHGNIAVRCDTEGREWVTIVTCPPSLVCRAGVCVDPDPSECGDGTCEADETCLLCATDCGCTGETVCLGAECVPLSTLVCGDGVCTADETCASCTEDCACGAGTACRDALCVPDDDCGDGSCAASENCGSCPTDCGCGDDERCRDGVCVAVPPTVQVSVVRSAASDLEASAWDDLNRDWRRFGDTPVAVEVTLLFFTGIGYDDVAATRANVLVIGGPAELTDDEIDAILRYVREGHGVIVTGHRSLWELPRLSGLVGVETAEPRWAEFGGGWPIAVRHLADGHPMLVGLPDPFEIEPCVSLSNWSLSADGEVVVLALFDGCELHDGVFSSGGIVARRGGTLDAGRAVLFTFLPELAGSDGTGSERATPTDRRLLYNAVLWAAARTD